MEWAISVLLGIGLAAAVGFRIFLPLLILSLTHRWGVMELSEGFQWIGSNPALILLLTATFLEILSYYIPWLDNLLDSITTPLAMICGTLVMASAMVEMQPWIKWTLAIIAGGGTAGLVKGTGAATRLISTASTGGLANPLVTTVETGGSFTLSLLSIFLPIVAGVLVIALVFYLLTKMGKFIRGQPGKSTTTPTQTD